MSATFQRWNRLVENAKAARDGQKPLKRTEPPRIKQKQEPRTHEQREKAEHSAISAMR